MITHIMNLQSPHFENIRDDKKTIEVRLYDEKRKKINLGDTIIFQHAEHTDQQVETCVIGLLRYLKFKDLVKDHPAEAFGFNSKEELLKAIFSFYTKKQEVKYGVVGIKIAPK